MAKHEGMHGKEHGEHMRKMEEARKLRAKGGRIDGEKAKDQDEEAEEEVEDAEHERARGGHIPHRGKKAGGKVEGKHPMARPDRRARGGATSDMNPETTAGKMSMMPYEKIGPKEEGSGGKGLDRD